MLPHSQRISVHLFKDIMKKGEVLHSTFFIIRCVNSQEKSHYAVSVSKKIAKTAVLRNKIRRRTYSIISQFLPRFKMNKKMIIIAKIGVEKMTIDSLKKEIEKIFVKSEFLK